MNIIVRTPNWLGDAIMALPVFANLRHAFPTAKIHAVARKNITAVFANSPHINEVTALPGNWQLLGNALSLRAKKYDLGILLTNSFCTALWLYLANAKQRIGYTREARSLLLTNAIVATPEILAAHQAEYYLNLLSAINVATNLTMPQLSLSNEGITEADALLQRYQIAPKNYAVIAPCSAFGGVKDWELSRYGEVARRLVSDHQLTVLLTGTAIKADCLSTIADDKKIINTAGALSLSGLFALLQKSRVYLGGDSGASHAAAALSVPTVAIFGITEPKRTAPLGEVQKIKIIGLGGVNTPNLRCPQIAETARRALGEISTMQVLNAINELI